MSWPASSARSSSGTHRVVEADDPRERVDAGAQADQEVVADFLLDGPVDMPGGTQRAQGRQQVGRRRGDGGGFSAHTTNVRRAGRTCDRGGVGWGTWHVAARCGAVTASPSVPTSFAPPSWRAPRRCCPWVTPGRTSPACSSAGSRARTPRPPSSTRTASCRRKATLGCTGHGVLGSGTRRRAAARRQRLGRDHAGREDPGVPPRGAPQRRLALRGRDAAHRRRHSRGAAGRPVDVPGDGFVTRSNATLSGLPLVGGLAAGSTGAGSTRLLIDGRVVDRGAVGVLLSGASVAGPW